MLGNLLGGFIVIIIGANLMSPVAIQIQSTIRTANYNSTGHTPPRGGNNISSSVVTILNLVPLFFALGIMSAGVAITVGGLRNAGIM